MGILDFIFGQKIIYTKQQTFGKEYEEISITDLPYWVSKRFRGWLPQEQYRDVHGKHYIYREWNDASDITQQGQDGETRYFRKKKYNW